MKVFNYYIHNWICLIPLTEAFSMLNRDRHQDFQNKTIQTISNSIFYFSSILIHYVVLKRTVWWINPDIMFCLLFSRYSLLRFQVLFHTKLPHCRFNFSLLIDFILTSRKSICLRNSRIFHDVVLTFLT